MRWSSNFSLQLFLENLFWKKTWFIFKIKNYFFGNLLNAVKKLYSIKYLNLKIKNKKLIKKYRFFYKKNRAGSRSTFFLSNSFINFKINNFLFSFNFFLNRKLFPLFFLTLQKVKKFLLRNYKSVSGDGFLYLRGLFIIGFVDACLTDDEPLWEPVEWSLVQTWILFIFIFAWIAENLITSRFGSYTGRDKRVWFAWYKTFWLLEFWYMASYASASLFVIVPFYYELTYSVAFVFSWWNWYTRIFFFKFVSLYSIILLLSYIFLINIRWLNWKKLMLMVLIINFFLMYLLFMQFVTAFFGYFTDIMWYQKTRFVDFIQLSHEPLKWGWGTNKRDHFTYHKTTTSFWFKNDGPFAGSFLMMNLFFFLILFFLLIFWLVLLRRIYATREVSYTYSTYCVSALRQFFFFFLMLYLFVYLSFIASYWRFPIEFIWIINSHSWWANFGLIIKDYVFFLTNIFF